MWGWLDAAWLASRLQPRVIRTGREDRWAQGPRLLRVKLIRTLTCAHVRWPHVARVDLRVKEAVPGGGCWTSQGDEAAALTTLTSCCVLPSS